MAEGPHQTLHCSIEILIKAKRWTGSGEPPLLMDPGGDEQGQRPSHWWKEVRASGRVSMGKHFKREWLHQCWGLALCPMAGSGIQAAPCPTWGLRLVGCPTLAQQAVSLGFHAPYQGLWCWGFPDSEVGEDPGLGPCTADLCRKVRDANRSSMWFNEGTPKMHGPLDVPQWRWNSRGLTFGACRGGTWNIPYSGGGIHLPGHGTQAARDPQGHIPPRTPGDPLNPQNPHSRLMLSLQNPPS